MKLKSFVLVSLLAATPLFADTYKIDRAHSEASFRIRHFVTKVSGRFDDFGGTITGDMSKPGASSVEFTIKATSIDTSMPDRDKHLRSADFFDVEKFPEITFKSTSIKASEKKNVYDVTGDLTMHGVTKQVTLPVEYVGEMKDPRGNTKAGFTLSTTLNRKDYGVNWNKTLDAGGVMLGDDVDITITLETYKNPPPPPPPAAPKP
jgi:polyisoprenoid-binding protein YceI